MILIISIPLEKEFSGCHGLDYAPTLGVSRTKLLSPTGPFCNAAPIGSGFGTVLGHTEYCTAYNLMRTAFGPNSGLLAKRA